VCSLETSSFFLLSFDMLMKEITAVHEVTNCCQQTDTFLHSCNRGQYRQHTTATDCVYIHMSCKQCANVHMNTKTWLAGVQFIALGAELIVDKM
jgi:hypothetical protein